MKAAGQGQYPSAQSHTTPQSVTQAMAKPAQAVFPKILEGSPAVEHTLPLLFPHSGGKGRALS